MSTARIYRFGSFSLDAGERTLFRDGHSIPIPPKDLEVLLVLVENSGRLVQKSFLMSRVWPGTFVEEGNLARHVSAIRSLLTGGMDGTGYIETIPKRGYRFVAKVERLNADSPDSIPAQFIAEPRTDRRASIAVLPFVNHSGNPEQEYFSDGMTDALTTALSRLPSLRVISRTSSMLYKTYTKSLPEIAGVLGVEFILEGSVVRAGSSVRITAQLIDAKDDSHVWADKYDGEIGDVLRLQDRVAAAVAKSIGAKESLGELRQPQSSLRVIPAAYDAYLEGRHAWYQAVESSLLKAVHCFETAITIDPEFAPPYAALANSYATM